MKRGVITAARLHQQRLEAQRGGFRWRSAMVTLTYRDDEEWSPRHISAFLKLARQWCQRKGVELRTVWVMELTKRGRPHYHVMFWVPGRFTIPKADKQGWWRYGMTRTEYARNPVGYLAKYASKGVAAAADPCAPAFPKGARIHGCGGLDREDRQQRTWWLSPAWVREIWGPEDIARPARGGGYASKATGEWAPSPWLVTFHNGQVIIRPRCPAPSIPTS